MSSEVGNQQRREEQLPDWLGITAHLSASFSLDDSYLLFNEDGEPCHEEERKCMSKADGAQTALSLLPEENEPTTFGRDRRQSEEEAKLQESFEMSPLASAYKRTIDRDPSWMFNIVDDLFTEDIAKACEMAQEIIENETIGDPAANAKGNDVSNMKRSNRRKSKDKLSSDSDHSSQSRRKKDALSTGSDHSSTRSRSKQTRGRDKLSSSSDHSSRGKRSTTKRDKDKLSSASDHSTTRYGKDKSNTSASEHSTTGSDKGKSKSERDRENKTGGKGKSSGPEKKKKSLWKDVKELVISSPKRRKDKSAKSPLQKLKARIGKNRDGVTTLPPPPALEPIQKTTKAKKAPHTTPDATKAKDKKTKSKKIPSSKSEASRSDSPTQETDPASTTQEDASTDASTVEDVETEQVKKEQHSCTYTIAALDKSDASIVMPTSTDRKRVVFASETVGKGLCEIHEVESYRGMELWYRRIELKHMMHEAEVIGGLYGQKCKELIAALNAIYQSFNHPLSEADKSMVMRFLALNSAARGLEHHVVSRGSFLSQKCRSLVLHIEKQKEIYIDADDEEKHGDVWNEVKGLSKEAQYMAIMLAEFDKFEADEVRRDSNPNVSAPVMLD